MSEDREFDRSVVVRESRITTLHGTVEGIQQDFAQSYNH